MMQFTRIDAVRTRLLGSSVVALGAFTAFFFACDDNTGTVAADYTALLQGSTNSVIVPDETAFAARADDLVVATKALEASPTGDTLAAAQSAWRAARAAYRTIDIASFGPIAELGISDRIDTAPATPSQIDAIVSGTPTIDVASVGVAGGHAKGFLGAEYLLFSAMGQDAALAKLSGADSAAARRRTLARAISEEIAASAHQLVDAWDPAKGGWATAITGAGKTSQHYATQRAALDDLVGGVAFAMEIVVGVRLATVLGRTSGGTPDPTQDATTASDSAVPDMLATLAGVKAVYHDGGFATFVHAKSAPLDAHFSQEIDACAAAVKAIPAPFSDAVTKNTATVQAAFDACKAMKLTWNTDLTSALGATLKPTINDGD
jgi:putative iron-regulated protein